MPTDPLNPALAGVLQDWLDYVNALPGSSVACHPVPDEAESWDEVYWFRPGQLLVSRNSPTALLELASMLGAHGMSPRLTMNVATVSLVWPADDVNAPTVPAMLDEMSARFPRLRQFVTPNHVGFPAVSADIAEERVYGAPWVNGGPGGAPEVPSAPYEPSWQTPPPDVPIKITVADTGDLSDTLDARGEEIKNPNRRNWTLGVNGDVEPQYYRDGRHDCDLFDDHGKMVAGILAAAAPGATVRVFKVYDNNGTVGEVELATRLRQHLAANPDVHLVNLSGGKHTHDNKPPEELQRTIDDFPNVLFVAAAGNLNLAVEPPPDPARPYFPAALGSGISANVIGVGATDADGVKQDYSSKAPSAQVWAHGHRVKNAFKTPARIYLPGNSQPIDIPTGASGTVLWSGTSFAAPLVAGLLAGYVHSLKGGPVNNHDALAWLYANFPAGAPVRP